MGDAVFFWAQLKLLSAPFANMAAVYNKFYESRPTALPVIRDKLRPGGALIADNMLMGGDVLNPKSSPGRAEGIIEFTRNITSNNDWIASVIPIRDGLLVAYRC